MGARTVPKRKVARLYALMTEGGKILIYKVIKKGVSVWKGNLVSSIG